MRAARRFLKRVRRDHAAARVLAVATGAVRDASNRDAWLVPLGRLGIHEIRILSGNDEGRLGAEAALRACPIERGLVVDLGGSSLQVTPVEALREWLKPMTVEHRSKARGVNPDRADVMLVGAIVLEELLACSRYPDLRVSRTSVREAVLWREAERLPS